jgi:hypothetical protein
VIVKAVGFCAIELYAFGPLQAQLVAPVAVPVKVSVLPKQTGLGLAVAVTAVGTEFTVIVIVLDVAVAGLAQGELEVIIQLMLLPFARLQLLYVGALPPTFEPFSCH